MAGNYTEFLATDTFWRSFFNLTPKQRERCNELLEVFKADPFDPRLRTHSIHSLTAKAKQTVYSITIEGNLRAVFVVNGSTVTTLDIGTHDVYR